MLTRLFELYEQNSSLFIQVILPATLYATPLVLVVVWVCRIPGLSKWYETNRSEICRQK